MLDNALERRVRERLAELGAEGLLRSRREPAGIDLSSNDYLALSRHPLIAERLVDAIVREGCGSTGSRLLRGERECFEQIEARFAGFKRADRALYFGSGYLANIAVLSTLPERGDIIFSDQLNHASLIDGARLARARTVVFPHRDVNALARMLAAERTAAPGAARFVVTESLFSMEGDEAPLAAYADVCQAEDALLIVDEAHAVGVYGARGTGLLEASGVDHGCCVSVNTAGKALGVAGAFVAGPSWAIDYLAQRARPFVFSTAPPPALADALDASLTIVETEPERRHRLRQLSIHLRRRLAEAGIIGVGGVSDTPPTPDAVPGSPIVSIVLGDNDRAVAVANLLQREGFDVRAIRPPSVPPGTARLRVSVNVGLSEELLSRFVERLSAALSARAEARAYECI